MKNVIGVIVAVIVGAAIVGVTLKAVTGKRFIEMAPDEE